MRCSVVIATLDRIASLRVVIDCLSQQTRPPTEVIISSAGDTVALIKSLNTAGLPFSLKILPSEVKSSALQRNAAAAVASGEIIAFLDDDIEFPNDIFARLLAYFERLSPEKLGGLSARPIGEDRPAPGRFTRLYYCLQSGYSHSDFGGKLFGPGINCQPVYHTDAPELIESEWLPSTCLFLRADLFHRERFPQFSGYSFAEDVHLTARIRQIAPLYFASRCLIKHHSLPSEFKLDRVALTAGKLHNMAVVARETLGKGGWALWWRWQLHRLFLAIVLVIRRPYGWFDELRGLALAHL